MLRIMARFDAFCLEDPSSGNSPTTIASEPFKPIITGQTQKVAERYK
jgi:hypothetical protein